ncbi:AmmeMemoRadiSam system protein A [Ferrimonas sp. SCSIO 43195]|uniref:AmmeMemoRadiSam system protein A n=1 Tax=Ferrimonas sp. SCSIO 43195 TaxID=2822844 RepID=UPI00207540E5|nr:AmmeMemoRadiSam system protein A [Ferrimonas sp. SCSIO 43195]USD39292.1 AmmeMemoRadiSam system protein A [Ferrimonas sp. SCSIO 43195]
MAERTEAKAAEDRRGLGTIERRQLLMLARDSIEYGLSHGCRQPLSGFTDAVFRHHAACFVTLTKAGALRGCVGTLVANQSLAETIAYFSYSAAFEDRRFEPLAAKELALVRIGISVLSKQQPMSVASDAQLLKMVSPGKDGLTVSCGRHHATFLPQVWESLPEPRAFVSALKAKAGLSSDFWSPEMRWFRYEVESFSEPG